MPRRKRIIIPGQPYHVTHRGNHRSPILETDDERHVYMSIMIRWAAETGVRVASFVLMLNHVHFVAESPTPRALSSWIQNGHREYSKWYNTVRKQSGCNWEGRFFSVLMDPSHCLHAVRYVEQNPVRAQLCKLPWEWKWSSAAWQAGLGPKPVILNADFRPVGTTQAAWRAALIEPTPEDFRRKLAEARRYGRPLAATEWVTELEERTGLRLQPRPRGRPRTAIAAVESTAGEASVQTACQTLVTRVASAPALFPRWKNFSGK